MTKFAIKKHLEFLTASYTIVTLGYFILSWLNIVSNNLNPNYVYPNWNVFNHLTNRTTVPISTIAINILFIFIIDIIQIIYWNSTHPKRCKITTKQRGEDYDLRILMQTIKKWAVEEQLCKKIRKTDKKHMEWQKTH